VTAPALSGLVAAPWLAERDPRLRVLAALGFALVVVGLTRPIALLLALAIALTLAGTAGLGVGGLVRRVAALEGLLLILIATLPFTVPGEGVWHFGSLTASREGVTLALIIAARASAVALVLWALVGTLEPVVLGHALGRLGVPARLVHLFLFTLRHIHALYGEYARLRQAMRARAFTPRSDRHTWNTLGWLMGMLLVRSLARSRRTLAAMRCRGFQGRLYLLDDLAWSPADTWLSVATALALAILFGLERLA
jgi:cobalt/nickel transport system permease protein